LGKRNIFHGDIERSPSNGVYLCCGGMLFGKMLRSLSTLTQAAPRERKERRRGSAKENEFEIQFPSDVYILFHAGVIHTGNSEKRLSFNHLTVVGEGLGGWTNPLSTIERV